MQRKPFISNGLPNFMSSFTTCINLRFALPPGLLSATSNISILRLMLYMFQILSVWLLSLVLWWSCILVTPKNLRWLCLLSFYQFNHHHSAWKSLEKQNKTKTEMPKVMLLDSLHLSRGHIQDEAIRFAWNHLVHMCFLRFFLMIGVFVSIPYYWSCHSDL